MLLFLLPPMRTLLSVVGVLMPLEEFEVEDKFVARRSKLGTLKHDADVEAGAWKAIGPSESSFSVHTVDNLLTIDVCTECKPLRDPSCLDISMFASASISSLSSSSETERCESGTRG